jgi:hypothetical protein
MEDMSAWLAYLSTPEFWTGAFISGLLSGVITFFSTRASDRRKFKQEIEVLIRKEEREDKLRADENLYTVTTEYTEVVSDILINAIDVKGIFNMFRDAFFNATGQPDPKAMEKFDRSEKIVESNKRIGVPFNKLRLVAPTNVLDAALQLNTAVLAVMRVTIEPFAMPVAYKTAGEQLDTFINVFREEVGRGEYTKSAAHKQIMTFMDTLKNQVNSYMDVAKADMKAAGFKTTPWDNLS